MKMHTPITRHLPDIAVLLMTCTLAGGYRLVISFFFLVRYSSWGGRTGPTSCSLPSTSLSALTSQGSTALRQQWPAACSSWVPSLTETAMLPQLQTPSTTSTCRTSRPLASASPQCVEKKRNSYAFQQSEREPPKAAARSYDHRP